MENNMKLHSGLLSAKYKSMLEGMELFFEYDISCISS